MTITVPVKGTVEPVAGTGAACWTPMGMGAGTEVHPVGQLGADIGQHGLGQTSLSTQVLTGFAHSRRCTTSRFRIITLPQQPSSQSHFPPSSEMIEQRGRQYSSPLQV
jgi:hypothetical protein